MKIDHIGIKVSSIELARASYQRMGLTVQESILAPEVGLKIAFVSFEAFSIELLEVISQTSPIADSPEGFNHLAFLVEDIHQMFHHIAKHPSWSVVSDITQGLHGRSLFFFKMEETDEALYECVSNHQRHGGPLEPQP